MAVFARAAMMLAENRVRLSRDVIFLAEPDEEAAQYNTTWLAERKWPAMDCEFALNEGGWIIKGEDGRVKVREHLHRRQEQRARARHGAWHVHSCLDAQTRQCNLHPLESDGEALAARAAAQSDAEHPPVPAGSCEDERNAHVRILRNAGGRQGLRGRYARRRGSEQKIHCCTRS